LNSEPRSVEVSFFVQQTEDEGKVTQAVRREIVGQSTAEERQEAEGHFGNKIVLVRFHMVGDEATQAFGRLMAKMEEASRREILGGIDSAVDEHGALFLRLNKQMLIHGVAVSTSSDPVRVKVKPRRAPREDLAGFYARLMESTTA
jgi:RNA binding exosome subunit